MFSFTCLNILKTSWSVISVTFRSSSLMMESAELTVSRATLAGERLISVYVTSWWRWLSWSCTLISSLRAGGARTRNAKHCFYLSSAASLCNYILSDICRALGSKYVKASCYSVTVRLHIIIHRWFSFFSLSTKKHLRFVVTGTCFICIHSLT